MLAGVNTSSTILQTKVTINSIINYSLDSTFIKNGSYINFGLSMKLKESIQNIYYTVSHFLHCSFGESKE